MGKSRIEEEDVADLYDTAYRQAQEDRDAIVEVFNDLRSQLSGSTHLYAASGDTLAKFAELRIKQNTQIVELLKIAQKARPDDGVLTAEDYDKIAEELKMDEDDES